MPNIKLICIFCRAPADMLCQRCRDHYCSAKCQQTDWPQHKLNCFPMPFQNVREAARKPKTEGQIIEELREESIKFIYEYGHISDNRSKTPYGVYISKLNDKFIMRASSRPNPLEYPAVGIMGSNWKVVNAQEPMNKCRERYVTQMNQTPQVTNDRMMRAS